MKRFKTLQEAKKDVEKGVKTGKYNPSWVGIIKKGRYYYVDPNSQQIWRGYGFEEKIIFPECHQQAKYLKTFGKVVDSKKAKKWYYEQYLKI